MTVDPIFNAFAAAESVWAEIDRLISAVPGAFAPPLTLSYDTVEGLDNDWADSRTGYHFEVRGAVPRQRVPGQLLLAFDLSRPETSSAWPHGRSSLLTCAYAHKYDQGWDLEHVVVGMNGRLASQETYDGCTFHADDRLLKWNDEPAEWSRHSWLFSIPLLAVDGHEAFEREIVAPVLGLVVANVTADEALAGTSAVQFARRHATPVG